MWCSCQNALIQMNHKKSPKPIEDNSNILVCEILQKNLIPMKNGEKNHKVMKTKGSLNSVWGQLCRDANDRTRWSWIGLQTGKCKEASEMPIVSTQQHCANLNLLAFDHCIMGDTNIKGKVGGKLKSTCLKLYLSLKLYQKNPLFL